MSFYKKFTFFLLGLLVILTSLFWVLSRAPLSFRAKVTNNELARNFLHVYRSMRGLPDVFFFPYLFLENKLPKYYLDIAYDDILFLNENLPTSSPFTSILLDKNRVFVKALFQSQGFESKVKVRYKGLNPDHWNSLKKSYKVVFSNDQTFGQTSELNFTIPFDKGYYAELLNQHRAQKLGLLTQNMRLGNLFINGQNQGVYIISDQWSSSLLEANRIPDEAIIFGVDDGSAEILGDDNEADYMSDFKLFSLDGINGWKSYTLEKENYEELQAFLSIISYASDEEFEKAIPLILDLNSFFAWDILSVLSGSVQWDSENLGMVFNTATGKFEFLPIDIMICPTNGQYTENSTISKRILAIDTFKEERNRQLKKYLEDKTNFEDDMQFYDNLYKETRHAFFQDYAKKHNNFTFLKWVKDTKQYVVDNFNVAWSVLENEYPPFDNRENNNFVFNGNFERFGETFIDREEFILKNPQFVKRGTDGIGLPSGRHSFSKSVIIPTGLQVEIDAGAILQMGSDVSFISYSPVLAQGREDHPIVIHSADPQQSWGTFAVLNTEQKKSTINNVEFSGGAGDFINGITITGMVAFHNSDVDISNSKFTNALNDDGLNIKYGNFILEDSFFENNFSDGVDIDFGSENGIIRNNTFLNNGYGGGGDAIDLSWSNIIVEGNKITGCTDKGVSVGEKSNPIIKNNTIQSCDIGIAVKDLSKAQIENNLIEDVRVGVAAYRKKEVFGGGEAFLSNNTLDNAFTDFQEDDLSKITILD